jgi:hypothetical protein
VPVPSSVLLVERRFTAFVGHSLADVGDLGAHLEHDPLDAAPNRKIATRRTPRRQARQCGQRDTGNAVDQFIDIRPAYSSRFFSIRRNCNISVLTATWAASASLRGDCCRSRRKYRR